MRPTSSFSSRRLTFAAVLILCLAATQRPGAALQPASLQRLVSDRCGSAFAASLSRSDTVLVFLPEGIQRLADPPQAVRRCSSSASGPCEQVECEHFWRDLPEAGLAFAESWCTSPRPRGSAELERAYHCGNTTVSQTVTEVVGSCQGLAAVRTIQREVFSCRVFKD